MGFSLSKLNPVKAIDNALVQLDKGVKNYGGWEVVGPAAAALVAAPYLAPELFAAEGLAGGTVAGTGLTGGAGATGLTAGATGAAGGMTVPLSSIQAASGLGLSGSAAAGLSAAQKAMLVRSVGSALGQMTSGGTDGMGGGGSSGRGNYSYANLPFLANPQQNTIQMQTGPDVSGSGMTTAGIPAQLDTTRHNLLMANLLRG